MIAAGAKNVFFHNRPPDLAIFFYQANVRIFRNLAYSIKPGVFSLEHYRRAGVQSMPFLFDEKFENSCDRVAQRPVARKVFQIEPLAKLGPSSSVGSH